MKKHLLTSALLFFFSFAFAQQVKEFTMIKVDNVSKVYLRQDSVFSVRQLDEDQVTNISVRNGELILDGDANSSFQVSLPVLKKITVDGIGSVTGQNTFTGENIVLDINGSGSVTLDLNVRKITAEVSGVGKIVLSGSADEAVFAVPGSGKVDASMLKVRTCNASISGMGKCLVDVSDELNADISGTGSVTYKTMPKTLNQNITGLGKVKALDSTATVTTDTTKFNFGESEFWIIGKKKNKETKKAKPIWAGFELGINAYTGSDGKFNLPVGLDNYDLRMEKSVSVGLNLLQQNFEIAKSNVWFVTGLGIHWNNWRFDSDVRMRDGTVTTTFRDTTSSVAHIKSKLTASYLTAPVMFQVLTSRDENKAFHFGAGAILGFRIGSHTKIKYEENGDTKKAKEHKDFNLNPFRYGFRVNFGYSRVNLFADIYASTLFRENRGPVLYPVNFGITVAGF